jgi:hypothetical protein
VLINNNIVIINVTIVSFLALAYLFAFPDHNSVTLDQMKFEKFIVDYKRSYDTQNEYDLRFKAFQINMLKAEEMNRRNPRATFGVCCMYCNK